MVTVVPPDGGGGGVPMVVSPTVMPVPLPPTSVLADTPACGLVAGGSAGSAGADGVVGDEPDGGGLVGVVPVPGSDVAGVAGCATPDTVPAIDRAVFVASTCALLPATSGLPVISLPNAPPMFAVPAPLASWPLDTGAASSGALRAGLELSAIAHATPPANTAAAAPATARSAHGPNGSIAASR